jgi:hypothetical protein
MTRGERPVLESGPDGPRVEQFNYYGSTIRITDPEAMARAAAEEGVGIHVHHDLPEPVRRVFGLGYPSEVDPGTTVLSIYIALTKGAFVPLPKVIGNYNQALSEKLLASSCAGDFELAYNPDVFFGTTTVLHRATGLRTLVGARYGEDGQCVMIVNHDPSREKDPPFPCGQPLVEQIRTLICIMAAVIEACCDLGEAFGVYTGHPETDEAAGETALHRVRETGPASDPPHSHTYDLKAVSDEQELLELQMGEEEVHEASIGLIKNPQGQLEFRMPRGPREIDAVLDFFLATLTHLLAAAHVETGILFIAAKAASRYGITVAAKKLFDTALADMLETTGEVDFKTAARAFEHAQAAPTEAEQKHHREDARRALLSAYESYDSAIQEIAGKPVDERPSLYAKAAGVAFILAAMEYELGHAAAADWAQHALAHYNGYENAAIDLAVARYEGLVASRDHMSRAAAVAGAEFGGPFGAMAAGLAGLGVGHVTYSGKIDKAYARIRLIQEHLEGQRPRFNRLHARLAYTKRAR